jgi:hypothetical protein
MDDESTDRESDGSSRRGFHISLGRLFGVTFWVCVFFGALSWLMVKSEQAHNLMEQYGVAASRQIDRATWPVTDALMVALLLASPVFAVASLVSWFRNKAKN